MSGLTASFVKMFFFDKEKLKDIVTPVKRDFAKENMEVLLVAKLALVYLVILILNPKLYLMKAIKSLLILSLPLMLTNCGQNDKVETTVSVIPSDNNALTEQDKENEKKFLEFALMPIDVAMTADQQKEFDMVRKYHDSIAFKFPKVSEEDKLRMEQQAQHDADSIAKTIH